MGKENEQPGFDCEMITPCKSIFTCTQQLAEMQIDYKI
jgi:hypothetical protein